MTPESLSNYLQIWNLSEPTLLAETHSSFIYTVAYQGETAVLKLLKQPGKRNKRGQLPWRILMGAALSVYCAMTRTLTCSNMLMARI
jgi:streptomycin 6-kinase